MSNGPQGWLYRLVASLGWWPGIAILVLIILVYFSMCMP